MWGLVSSFLFALFYEVNMMNLCFYLIPGIVYSFLFVKYGFLAIWIRHSVFNATSSSVRNAVVYLFGL
ncbi:MULTISPECIES: CPBP family glutamic-type intramembrane protease [Bacillus cereus group]|uniref:CPBP family glutamic-type intramembrane protease n=1 Tax=Bacillus cereus group TaxID=86661 RepID=UPI0020D262ED|nr:MULTISPECIES: CPBP family glutamic-type intramembrane protease [Bacillus cereus group]